MPLLSIPIEFDWEGMWFEGELSTSKGNENVWQLTLYRRSYGQLVKYINGWKWCPNIQNRFTEPFMEEFFVSKVENYLKAKD